MFRTMSAARSYDETTVRPPIRSARADSFYSSKALSSQHISVRINEREREREADFDIHQLISIIHWLLYRRLIGVLSRLNQCEMHGVVEYVGIVWFMFWYHYSLPTASSAWFYSMQRSFPRVIYVSSVEMAPEPWSCEFNL